MSSACGSRAPRAATARGPGAAPRLALRPGGPLVASAARRGAPAFGGRARLAAPMRAAAEDAKASSSSSSSPPSSVKTKPPASAWLGLSSLPLESPLPSWYGSPPRAPPSGRRAGVLLHPSSLPGRYGAGEIGEEAVRWVRWLAAAGQTVWQVLPLCPPEVKYWSPYSSPDALAGNPLLLPLDGLVELGLVTPEEADAVAEGVRARGAEVEVELAAQQAEEDALERARHEEFARKKKQEEEEAKGNGNGKDEDEKAGAEAGAEGAAARDEGSGAVVESLEAEIEAEVVGPEVLAADASASLAGLEAELGPAGPIVPTSSSSSSPSLPSSLSELEERARAWLQDAEETLRRGVARSEAAAAALRRDVVEPVAKAAAELSERAKALSVAEKAAARVASVASAAAKVRESVAAAVDAATRGAGASSASAALTAPWKAIYEVKTPVLELAARRLLALPGKRAEVEAWAASEAPWAPASAEFAALCAEPSLQGKDWWTWPEGLRKRDAAALAAWRAEPGRAEAVAVQLALQYLFEHFWSRVRAEASSLGVSIVGDAPIYVGAHSADVWASPQLFELDPDSYEPARVSGVPPDAFSETGQLWGSPLYRWTEHERTGYAWWRDRLARCAALYDETRIDHFRAFAGYWAVDAAAETAMGGEWLKGPGAGPLLARARGSASEDAEDASSPRPALSILAEDLGVITPDVVALRRSLGAPGMSVLQFAFGGGADNIYLPHNIREDSFVYSGTHDNDTTAGWWATLDARARAHAAAYLGGLAADAAPADATRAVLRAVYASAGRTAVVPAQDLFALGSDARMNVPGKAGGNWRWRLGHDDDDVWKALQAKTQETYQQAKLYGRLPEKKDE